MNFFFLLLLVAGLQASECASYNLQGRLDEKQGLFLRVNEGTNSQKNFLFSRDIEFSMVPYLNRSITGKFVIQGTQILQADNISIVVPDPLYHHEEMIKLSSVPCPKGKKKEGPEGPSQKKKIIQ